MRSGPKSALRPTIIKASAPRLMDQTLRCPQRLIHMARFIREVEEALVIARRELGDGYLVNLRTEVVWGSEHEFDRRAVN